MLLMLSELLCYEGYKFEVKVHDVQLSLTAILQTVWAKWEKSKKIFDVHGNKMPHEHMVFANIFDPTRKTFLKC